MKFPIFSCFAQLISVVSYFENTIQSAFVFSKSRKVRKIAILAASENAENSAFSFRSFRSTQ